MARKQAPATKAGKLMEQLGRLSAARELDDFAIRRVERAAKALMDVDPASAHTALGGAAAFRGDAEAARSHHRIALRLADNETTQFNYAVSLSLLEETEEAFEVATAALERFPDDLAQLADRVATRPDLLENPGLTFTVGFVGTSADGSEPLMHC